MRFLKLGLALSMMLTAATAARAQPVPGGEDPGGGQQSGAPSAPAASGDVITSVTPEQLAQMFGEAGFQAQALQQTEKDTALVKADFYPGMNIGGGAILNSCENGRCGWFSLIILIQKARVPRDWACKWDAQMSFVRASIDDAGTLSFKWDVPVLLGVSRPYIIQTMKIFKEMVNNSSKFKG